MYAILFKSELKSKNSKHAINLNLREIRRKLLRLLEADNEK